MIDLTGKKIGRYRIEKKIGEGGMAYVYLAEDMTLHRQVALKMIRTSEIPPSQLEKLLERFKREAEALARLSDDPGIVTVYDYGDYENTPFLVMAYMRGGTLKDMLGKPMDYKQAARLLLPVVDALAEAHQQGIIHRDVKPSNLLVDKRGQLALADFGIAKALEMEGQTLTGTGMGVGTPEYMAPEQWRGESTFQTDIYSLGVVFYEMVTGKKPYSGSTPSDVFLKQMTEVPVPPREIIPGIPEEVENILSFTLAKDQTDRYSRISELREDVEKLMRAETEKFIEVPHNHDETIDVEPINVEEKKPDFDVLSESKTEQETIDELMPIVQPPFAPLEDNTKKIIDPVSSDENSGNRKSIKSKKALLWILLGVVVSCVLCIVLSLLIFGPNLMQEIDSNDNGEIVVELTSTPVPSTPTKIPTPTLGVGSTRIREDDDMEMVYVPSGRFTSGISQEDIDWLLAQSWCDDCVIEERLQAEEMPQQSIQLDAFWIDKYEVTNAQFAQFIDETDYFPTSEEENQIFSTDDFEFKEGVTWRSFYENTSGNFPAIVSWSDATAYCEWVGGRLPTEAEWEKTARGTVGQVFPWGDEQISNEYLSFDPGEIQPVGSFPKGASPYGALDMSGNVSEWVYDWFDEDYYSERPLSNPTGPNTGETHAMRGGTSTSGGISAFRTSGRDFFWDVSTDFIGFRCVMGKEITPVKTPSPSSSNAEAKAALPDAVAPLVGDILYGPVNGDLEHSEFSDKVSIDSVDGNYQDFVFNVSFVNPYTAATKGWSYGVFFRIADEGKHYRFYVTSTGTWELDYYNQATGNITTVQNGWISKDLMNSNKDEENTITLAIDGENSKFYMNGDFVDDVPTPLVTDVGEMLIGTCFREGEAKSKGVTIYDGLTIWEIK